MNQVRLPANAKAGVYVVEVPSGFPQAGKKTKFTLPADAESDGTVYVPFPKEEDKLETLKQTQGVPSLREKPNPKIDATIK